jgi:hypothetical protein
MFPEMLPRLWAFALRISGDRHDAEDLDELFWQTETIFSPTFAG